MGFGDDPLHHGLDELPVEVGVAAYLDMVESVNLDHDRSVSIFFMRVVDVGGGVDRVSEDEFGPGAMDHRWTMLFPTLPTLQPALSILKTHIRH